MQDQLILTNYARDTIEGLSAPQKYLSSKYFYDDKGSEIFQKIMRMPEYYLTDCELEIFNTYKQEILDCFIENESSFEFVELGAGDGLKTKILLKYFLHKNIEFEYAPIDISEAVVVNLIDDLKTDLPQLKTKPLIGDYFELLEQLNKTDSTRKILLFLGSNIGNFEEKDAISFFKELNKVMQHQDLLFIGFDLKKDPNIILNAYDDPHGLTAEFNLNLLDRMNKELGANFYLKHFKHEEVYDENTGAARSYIVSLKNQEVIFNDIESCFSFQKNEKIYVEISQKFDEKMIQNIAQKSGFKIAANFTDSKSYFLDSLWEIA
jgi:dimethylhistidine N-methyltransferase